MSSDIRKNCKITLQIAGNLVEIATLKEGYNLISQIKKLRSELLSTLNFYLPAVRIMDSSALAENGFKILIKGETVFERILAPLENEALIFEVINDFKENVTKNINRLD